MTTRTTTRAILLATLTLAACAPPEDDAGLDGENEIVEQELSGAFTLKAVHSGKCLDVAGASLDNGAAIHQWDCHGRANQQWKMRYITTGNIHEVISVNSSKCMDVKGVSLANGAQVHQWGCNGKDNQRWKLSQVETNVYQLRAIHSGKCLEVAGGSTANGALLVQNTCGTSTRQRFRFTSVASSEPTPTPPPPTTTTPTTGWTQKSYTYSIHKPWNLSLSQRYRYDSATGTHYLWVYNTDEPHYQGSPTEPRCELRIQNDYKSGNHQFEADVYVVGGTHGTSIMQVFGGSTHATSIMLAAYNENGGTLKRYNNTVLKTGIYDKWFHLNVVHNALSSGTGTIKVYIDYVLVGTFPDDGTATHYFKAGVYHPQSSRAESRFKNIKYWVK
jgi:hypothetical protein